MKTAIATLVITLMLICNIEGKTIGEQHSANKIAHLEAINTLYASEMGEVQWIDIGIKQEGK